MDYLIPSSSNMKYFLSLDIENIFYYNKAIYTYELNKKLVSDLYKGEVKHINSLFKDIQGKSLKAPLKDINARFYLKLLNYAKSIEDCTEELLTIRMKKNQNEIKLIKKASIESLKLLNKIASKLDPDLTEAEVEILIKRYTLNKKLSFDPIIASYKNAKYPHYKASRKKIDKAVLIDLGLENKWYKGDVTDFFILKPDNKLEEKYKLIKKIFEYIVNNIKPGMLASELDKIYRKAYKLYNLPLPPHSIGHGLGIDIHEYPIIDSSSNHKLEDVVITIEPGYYGNYGIRYERDIIIYKDGVEILDI